MYHYCHHWVWFTTHCDYIFRIVIDSAIHFRAMANEMTGCWPPQMAKKHFRHLLERQGDKWRSQGAYWTKKDREYTQRKIVLACSHESDGPLAHPQHYSKHCTRRCRDSGEDQVWKKIYKDCDSGNSSLRTRMASIWTPVGSQDYKYN